MQSGGNHDTGVEDLVVAVDPGPRVGTLAGIDDGAEGVQQAACHHEGETEHTEVVEELRHRPDGDPSDGDVGHGHGPARRVQPGEAHDDPGDRGAQDEAEHDPGVGVGQRQAGNGGVGARDADEDHRVVGAAHAAPGYLGPVHPVVEGARGQHRPDGETCHGGAELCLGPARLRPMSGPTPSMTSEAPRWNQPRRSGFTLSAVTGSFAWATVATADTLPTGR